MLTLDQEIYWQPRAQWTLHHRQCKGHEPRGNDFGERSQEQPMKMESNKAFHPYGAQSAPRVNADVRLVKIKLILDF